LLVKGLGLAIDGQPISYDSCKFSVQYRDGTIKKISINDLSLIDPELGTIYATSTGLKPGEKINGTASYSENGQTVSTRVQLVFLNKPELKYRLIIYVNKFNYVEYWGYPVKDDIVSESEVGKNIVVIESTFPIYYEQKYTWYSGDFKTDYYGTSWGMSKVPTHLTVGGYIYDIGVVVPRFYGNTERIRDEFIYGDLPSIENYYKTRATLYYNDNDTQYSYGFENTQENPLVIHHEFGGVPRQSVTIYPPGEEASSFARKTYFGFSNIDSRPFGEKSVPISFELLLEKHGIPLPILQGNYPELQETYDYSIVNPDLNIPYISLPYRDYSTGFIKEAHAWNCFMSGIITFSSDYRVDGTVNHNTSYKLADLSHTVDIVYDNSPHFESFAAWKNNAIDIVKQTITDLGGEVGVIEQT
jgi:hypothetical protein